MANPSTFTPIDWGVIIVGTGVLILTSGIPVRSFGAYIRSGKLVGSIVKTVRQWGEYEGLGEEVARANKIVGKCENLLVVIFIFANSYTALAVIFAAEGLVSLQSDDDDYPFHHLAGTMVNFTYSILFALLLLGIVQIW